jgi:hypothetical protein
VYIGKTPTVGNFQVCDAISVVNGQAAYTLQVGGVNVAPESANHMLVSLNGILQKPGSSFTISGSTMTFASNLATGDVIDFVQILGNVLDIGQPSDDTVKTASLQSNAVTSAKMFSGFANGITQAQQWRVTSSFTFSTTQDVDSNWEISDGTGYGSIGSNLTQSSGIFTFPSTGIYLIMAVFSFRRATGDRIVEGIISGTTNNSTYNNVATSSTSNSDFGGSDNTTYNANCDAIFDVTDTSNVKFKLRVGTPGSGSDQTCDGDSSQQTTGFTCIRLGDT